MGIDLGCHQLMQISPSMHIRSPEAIITRRRGELLQVLQAATAVWRPVAYRLLLSRPAGLRRARRSRSRTTTTGRAPGAPPYL